MVQVTVKRDGQAGRVFDVGTTAELLENVDKSRHFVPGGTLEDAQGVVLGSSYPLKEGADFEWFPPAQGAGTAGRGQGAGAAGRGQRARRARRVWHWTMFVMHPVGLSLAFPCTRLFPM